MLYKDIINKLTKENYILELHGMDEVNKFKKICKDHCINTDILIRSFGCEKIKDKDKIYAVYTYIASKTTLGYELVLFFHESIYTVQDDYNIICFNNNSNHTNDLISWIK